MDAAEIAKRFDHHPPNGDKVAIHEAVRAMHRKMAEHLDRILPESREKSLAFTSLEESLMWSNACIARNIE